MSAPERRDDFGGIVAMVAAMAAFTISDVFTKLTTATLPIGEVLAGRGLIAVALFGAIALYSGTLPLVARRFSRIWGLRIACEMSTAVAFVSALTVLPIATVVAILQTAPLLLTAVGALVFGELVGARRWGATVAGFCGMLLVVKPGAASFDPWTLLAVAAMVSVVLRDIATRQMSRDIPTVLVTLTSTMGVMLIGVMMAPFERAWRAPTPTEWSYMAAGAIFVAAAVYCSIEAVRRADLAAVAPFRYSNLLFSLFAGWMVWREWPDLLALIGMAIIALAGVSVFWDARRTRREATR